MGLNMLDISYWGLFCHVSAIELMTWLSWLPMATLLLPLAWFMYVHVIFPRTSKHHRITEYQIAHGDFPVSWCSDHAHACLVPQGDLRTSSPGRRRSELQGLQGFWWTVFLLGLAPSPPCFWFLDGKTPTFWCSCAFNTAEGRKGHQHWTCRIFNGIGNWMKVRQHHWSQLPYSHNSQTKLEQKNLPTSFQATSFQQPFVPPYSATPCLDMSSITTHESLAQLCNPTAKGASKVPGLFRFFGVHFRVSPRPHKLKPNRFAGQ